MTNVQVKVNGIPDVIITERYLNARKRTVRITKFGNVLVNITLRDDYEGIIDLFALLHLEVGDLAANPSQTKSDLSSALDWTVATLSELRASLGDG